MCNYDTALSDFYHLIYCPLCFHILGLMTLMQNIFSVSFLLYMIYILFCLNKSYADNVFLYSSSCILYVLPVVVVDETTQKYSWLEWTRYHFLFAARRFFLGPPQGCINFTVNMTLLDWLYHTNQPNKLNHEYKLHIAWLLYHQYQG